MAVGRIPPQPGLDALLQRAPRPWLLTAVDGIASAENLGAIVRNAAAFGTDALVVGETCGSPFQRRAVSGSMGTIFSQPVTQVADLRSTLRDLQRRGVRCVAAHLGPGTLPLRQVDLRGDVCVVLGAEGPGLSPAVLAACDVHAEVPMLSHMNSLNVASAAAVFLYEARRQRD